MSHQCYRSASHRGVSCGAQRDYRPDGEDIQVATLDRLPPVSLLHYNRALCNMGSKGCESWAKGRH